MLLNLRICSTRATYTLILENILCMYMWRETLPDCIVMCKNNKFSAVLHQQAAPTVSEKAQTFLIVSSIKIVAIPERHFASCKKNVTAIFLRHFLTWNHCSNFKGWTKRFFLFFVTSFFSMVTIKRWTSYSASIYQCPWSILKHVVRDPPHQDNLR